MNLQNQNRPRQRYSEYQIYNEINKRKSAPRVPQSKRPVIKISKRRHRSINVGAVLAVLIFAGIIAFSIYIVNKRGEIPDAVSGDTTYVIEVTTEAPKYFTVTVDSAKLHTGNLILVNGSNVYVEPQDTEIVNLYENKTSSKVNENTIMIEKQTLLAFNRITEDLYKLNGCNDIIVTSGYRTLEEQQAIYDDRVNRYGESYAMKYVATPGYSEHHTGLALDLSVCDDNGGIYSIYEYEKTAWFLENAPEYGFILRYPEDKTELTGISHEPWHYRYVGLPHSKIISELNICLEEYITLIKNYTWDEKLLYTKDGELSTSYAYSDIPSGTLIYFVPASGNEKTEITVPTEREYTISGNNTDGYIVTVFSE